MTEGVPSYLRTSCRCWWGNAFCHATNINSGTAVVRACVAMVLLDSRINVGLGGET
ncbi:hypothetical protein HN588_17510 [Candidatus Bathyarchaeota archaeon]|nr:hypothetical protein [Candidatus Bathyarchaeota archaeon]